MSKLRKKVSWFKRILNYIDSFDLGHPKTIPCNPNCLVRKKDNVVIVDNKKEYGYLICSKRIRKAIISLFKKQHIKFENCGDYIFIRPINPLRNKDKFFL